MNAVEFVKKYGWNDARVCILNCANPQDRWLMRHGDLISDNYFDDLKRLVESHELVEKLGGLKECKKLVVDYGRSESSDHLSYYISDVESCL